MEDLDDKKDDLPANKRKRNENRNGKIADVLLGSDFLKKFQFAIRDTNVFQCVFTVVELWFGLFCIRLGDDHVVTQTCKFQHACLLCGSKRQMGGPPLTKKLGIKKKIKHSTKNM